MSRDREQIQKELEGLERDGIVKPSDVVEFARNPETALHACFEWDDSKAAESFRLDQARTLIRCYVIVSDAQPNESVRAFVALRSDRKDGGGYRKTVSVMSDAQLHAALMRDALVDLRSAQKKYSRLNELQKVFAEIDRAERAFERKQRGNGRNAA